MAKPLVYQVITLARQLIDDEARWAQRFPATLADGTPVEPHDPRASRFCAGGAMIRAGFGLTNDIHKAIELRDAACASLLPHTLWAVYRVEDINDGPHGHDAVLRLFDEYLESA